MADKQVHRLGRRMLTMYREVESVFAVGRDMATCRPGCAHCCRLLAVVSIPEAIAMVDAVLAAPRGRERLAAVVGQCRDLAERFGMLVTEADYFRAQVPCPLLDDNARCTVYLARPTVCRAHFVVTEPSLCEGPDWKVVGKVDLRQTETYVQGRALLNTEKQGLPTAVAPLHLGLVWAAVLVVDGRDAFARERVAWRGTVYDVDPWCL